MATKARTTRRRTTRAASSTASREIVRVSNAIPEAGTRTSNLNRATDINQNDLAYSIAKDVTDGVGLEETASRALARMRMRPAVYALHRILMLALAYARDINGRVHHVPQLSAGTIQDRVLAVGRKMAPSLRLLPGSTSKEMYVIPTGMRGTSSRRSSGVRMRTSASESSDYAPILWTIGGIAVAGAIGYAIWRATRPPQTTGSNAPATP